ncbi:hypothetical protein OROMI_026676 [Orobanche minor]
MAFVLLRRATFLRTIPNYLMSSQRGEFSTLRASPFLVHDRGQSITDRLHLSPLFSEIGKDDMKDCKIEVMDDASWHVSSGLADAWRGNNEDKRLKMSSSSSDCDYDDGGSGDDDNVMVCSVVSNKNYPDFDEIEDLRIRGNLFYKLDKDSKECDEYKFDFHGKKSARNEKNRKEIKENRKKENPKKKDMPREIKKINKERKTELLLENHKDKHLIPRLYETGDSCVGKKQRSPTFNQLTAPYHEPFCLDIYVSKGSVRASIIHRATSNVVAVSHSISKDMKFDLGSTKNRSACGAVGKVLAQRALEDDIHNVVYTPRKGDKLEGKLQIVLKAIIDGGVDVKVKLKQRKTRQARGVRPGTHDRHY